METEIVLFLRESVPEADLQKALAEVFTFAADADDMPLVVRYTQGFAVGVSVPCGGTATAERAAGLLCARLRTAILLETCCRLNENVQWLLFSPGTPQPLAVDVVELRHGLDVVIPLNRPELRVGAAYA